MAVPTTLVWGRHDIATPLEIAEAASARYGWRLHVIENAADDPPIEQPQAFLRALNTALALTEECVGDGRRCGSTHGGGVQRRDCWPRTAWLRPVAPGLQRDDRPSPGADRRCTDARDVSAAVNFARDSGLPLSVDGGGHNVTGNAVCDDGVTIDLRPMKGLAVDPVARTCRAEAGLTWGEPDAVTQDTGSR